MTPPETLLPTFFVLGAQRSGTTWLAQVLKHHPEITVARGKEPDFFYRGALGHPLRRYLDGFEGENADPPHPLRGDMSVNYCMLQKPVIRQIHHLLPKLRLVLTLRDPVERSWSQMKLKHELMHEVWLRHRTTRASRSQLEALGVETQLRLVRQERVRRRSDYLAIIDNWTSVYGSAALHIDLYDRLVADPYGYVHDILAHVGANTDWSPPLDMLAARTHAGTAHEMPPLLEWDLSRRWLEPTRALNQRLGGRVDHWVERMARVVAAGPPRRQLASMTASAVMGMAERLAYQAYDAQRQYRLAHRVRRMARYWPDVNV